MLNRVEQRKALRDYWVHTGYNPDKIDKMTDSNVYALYMKYNAQITNHIKKGRNVHVLDRSMVTERDHWSDKEWDDYAFEEREDD